MSGIDYFLQQLVNGLSLGAIYALIALGYTMVYGIIGMINFAHGDIYMIGAFISLTGFLLLAALGITFVPLAIALVLVIAIAFTAAYGWSVERIAYRPLRGAPRLAPLISAIGVSIVLQNYVQLSQGARARPLQPMLQGAFTLSPTATFHFTMSLLQILIIGVTIMPMIVFTYLIQTTPFGRAQRAIEQDRFMAVLSGVDVDRAISLTFMLGAALAAVAGLMVTLYYGVIDFYIGFTAGIKAFTAAVLGGIGSIPGAMLGGFLIGLIEAFWSGYFSIAYKDVAVFVLGFRLVDSAQGLSLSYRLSWVLYAAITLFIGRLVLTYTGLAGHFTLDGATRLFRHPVLKRSAPARWPRRLAGMLLVGLALGLPWFGFADRNLIDRATLILIYVMLGTGLNIVVGLAGLLDLGYVAFYAVGAYSYALLSQHFGLSFWACLPLAGLFAASFGMVLGFPVLRLRGDYLAIVTLGFGEITHVVLVNWTPVTGGPNGIAGIARPSFFGLPFVAGTPEAGISFAQYFGLPFSPLHRVYFLYYLILAIVLIAAAFVWRIRRLPLGRAWEALRENEIACRSLGLNPTTIKLSAFALGAAFAGFAGCFFAARQGFISPESFTFIESAIILAIVVLGGMGSQLGIAIAAVLIVGLPEWFRGLDDVRMLAFGAAMVLVMLWRPQGLAAAREPTVRLMKHGETTPPEAAAA